MNSFSVKDTNCMYQDNYYNSVELVKRCFDVKNAFALPVFFPLYSLNGPPEHV